MPRKPSWSWLSHQQDINGIRRRGKSHDVRGPGVSLGTGDCLQHKLNSTLESCVFWGLVIEREKGVDQEGSALAMVAHGAKAGPDR